MTTMNHNSKAEIRRMYGLAKFVVIPAKPKIKRVGAWTNVRKKWLSHNPKCTFCGRQISLAVHHIIPVHIDPSKELDETNLMTLCEGSGSHICHFVLGHIYNWSNYNPNIKTQLLLSS